MKLTELDPRWLEQDGRRVGFVFRCPLPGRRRRWQSCFFEKLPTMYGGRDADAKTQLGAIRRALPDIEPCDVQLCRPDCQWTCIGGVASASFETLTVHPSLDGSKGGNWHGFITKGQIVGGP